jgi:hypothetical protein
MSSEKKTAANRRNGRKGRGPTTAAGKAQSSRNALRHGLAAISRSHPNHRGEIEDIARRIDPDGSNPLKFEQAIIIAENELILRAVRAQRVGVIDRMRDVLVRPLAERDRKALRLGKARIREAQEAFDKLVEIYPLTATEGVNGVEFEIAKALVDEGDANEVPIARPGYMSTEERDEVDALREAMPDLARLRRYERRAWSRRRTALQRFIQFS